MKIYDSPEQCELDHVTNQQWSEQKMSYDLDTINQAWYIACEECMENKPNDIPAGPMLIFIAEYCIKHAHTLLRQAANELNERRDNGLPKD